MGKHNCLYIHLTLIPYLKAAGEAKTKPTQHSVGQLRQIGIQPDILICRTEREMTKDMADKIALFCNVEQRAVIEERDKTFSIYEVPLSLVENRLDELIVEKLDLPARPLDIGDWRAMLQRVLNRPTKSRSPWSASTSSTRTLTSRSTSRSTTPASPVEPGAGAQDRGGGRSSARGPSGMLGGVDGILVPGGFGYRGIPGKVEAIRFARKRRAVLRHLPGPAVRGDRVRPKRRRPGGRQHDGDRPQLPHPVVCLLDNQYSITDMGGTMRLGLYPCQLAEGSRALAAYGGPLIQERHRHRYEFNNQYRQQFLANGMAFSGLSPDGKLVEVIELPSHPWFVAVQCHPEFKSKPTQAHPLFRGFVKAALERREKKKSEAAARRGRRRGRRRDDFREEPRHAAARPFPTALERPAPVGRIS